MTILKSMRNCHFINQKIAEKLNEVTIRSMWKNVNNDKSESIDLTLGNPTALPPPKFIRSLTKILKTKVKPRDFGYMDNAGYERTRKAVASDLIKDQLFVTGLNINHIVMTAGASGAINCILKTILNPGDEVVIFAPYFVDYISYVNNYGGLPVIVDLDRNDWGINFASLEKAINKKTKAVIINSPHNPTGHVMSEKEIRTLHKILRNQSKKYGRPIYIISDEVYREIIYPPKKFFSPATDYNDSFIVYSYSKSLNIPGERIGYIALNPKINHAAQIFEAIKLAERVLGFTNASGLMQRVLSDVLPFKVDTKRYMAKRNKLARVLSKNGFDYILPDGAFYFLVNIPAGIPDFYTISQNLGLFVVDSKPFGVSGYFRIAYCVTDEVLNKACTLFTKLGEFLSKA